MPFDEINREFSFPLQKIIDEYKLEVIYMPDDGGNTLISDHEINRPGLQFAGFYEYFDKQRIQVMGRTEHSYLSTLEPNVRRERIDNLLSYKFPATKAAAARTITPGHKMLYPNDSRYYAGIVGGKTGYTSKAGNTLVTCVEKDSVRMVAVILKSKSTHYADTKKMLDYGYQYVNTEKGNTTGNSTTTTTTAKQETAGKWVQDNGSWRYEFADGTKAVGTIYTIDAADFGFDPDGKMVTGWKMFGTDWYYFESNGTMAKNAWRQDSGKWFYLGADGKIVRNTTIDNKYKVGADGAWVQ